MSEVYFPILKVVHIDRFMPWYFGKADSEQSHSEGPGTIQVLLVLFLGSAVVINDRLGLSCSSSSRTGKNGRSHRILKAPN